MTRRGKIVAVLIVVLCVLAAAKINAGLVSETEGRQLPNSGETR